MRNLKIALSLAAFALLVSFKPANSLDGISKKTDDVFVGTFNWATGDGLYIPINVYVSPNTTTVVHGQNAINHTKFNATGTYNSTAHTVTNFDGTYGAHITYTGPLY